MQAAGDRPTVLYVCHNHPMTRPGGAEIYAYELFKGVRQSDAFDAVFLAKGGPPLARGELRHPGTVFTTAGAPDEYLFFTDGYEFDWLHWTITDKDYYSLHLRRFLEAVAPDVVHFQHTQFLGLEALRVVKQVLPDAPIVYTLHEYSAICHRQGQMLRVQDDTPCPGASPRRCHECFPDVAPSEFFLRERLLKSHMSLVDMFISPSTFLRDRYVEWGIPAEQIIVEENGRDLPARTAVKGDIENDTDRPRNRFGYFGQLSPYKGAHVILEAMAILDEEDDRSSLSRARVDDSAPRLRIHGANLDLQHGVYRERIGALLRRTDETVTFAGPYERSRLAALIQEVDWVVLPSIWYENAPLVIQEAFHYGRPVICGDIGGMAEKVRDGVDGLHFRAGDAHDLAATMRRAATTPQLWNQLQRGIEPVHSLEAHMDRLFELYSTLLTAKPTVQAYAGQR